MKSRHDDGKGVEEGAGDGERESEGESKGEGEAKGEGEGDGDGLIDAARMGEPLVSDGDKETDADRDGDDDGVRLCDGEGDCAARDSSPCPRRAKPAEGPLTEPVKAFVEMPPQKPCAVIVSVETAGGRAYVQSLYVGPELTIASPVRPKYVFHPPIRNVSLRVKGVDDMLTDAQPGTAKLPVQPPAVA